MNRSMLVVACSGLIASVAVAGPKTPKVTGGAQKKAQQNRQLQVQPPAPNARQVPHSWVKIQKLADGRIVGNGPVMPYVPPAGTDAPTVKAFDIFQADATVGNPIGGECTGGGQPGNRWYFGTAYNVPLVLNDFTVAAGTENKPFDRLDIAWNWGVGALRPMAVGIFIDDTYGGCGAPPASSGPIDGVAYLFLDSAGGGGYFYSNIGLPPDPVAGVLAPADGNGTYTYALGAFDTTTNQLTLETTVPGTQVMLWGKNDAPNMPGTTDSNQWDDDAPVDGVFGAAECYPYIYAVPCPADGVINAMFGVWVDDAGGGGCYANCDGSTGTPVLTANDFQCFLNLYAAQDPVANCDGSTGTPALTANDFQCFLNEYAAGCS